MKWTRKKREEIERGEWNRGGQSAGEARVEESGGRDAVKVEWKTSGESERTRARGGGRRGRKARRERWRREEGEDRVGGRYRWEERDHATTKGRRGEGKKRGIIPTGCVEPLSATRAQPRMGFWCDHITFSSCLSLLCPRCLAGPARNRRPCFSLCLYLPFLLSPPLLSLPPARPSAGRRPFLFSLLENAPCICRCSPNFA